jgi:tetratricopeptide (TPR) repeat protein
LRFSLPFPKLVNGQGIILLKRMKRTFLYIAFFCAGLLTATLGFAHGDIHQQIEDLTSQLDPGRPSVEKLLQRAELWRLDGDYLSALADCASAAKADPANAQIHLERAKIFSDEKRFNKAVQALNIVLEKYPHQAEALLLRARAWKELGNSCKAQLDYAAAIEAASSPQPDTYLEFARLLQSSGQGEAAIRLLDQGTQKLGGAIVFDLLAIDLQVESNDFDAALTRLDKLIAYSPRKEKWLLKRGQILESARRKTEALETYKSAALALAALPGNFQISESSQQLLTDINSARQRLKNSHE